MSESNAIAIAQPTRLAPIQPHTFEDIQKYALVMAESDLVPKDYKGKPANVCVAIIMGRELGVPPMQALQGIAVINGRPSVWGDLMWALVTGHPEFEDAQESVDDAKAVCTLKRRDRSPVTEEFSQADAQKAGLWGKQGPWTQYPKRMMLWRARTFAARNLFADALKGIQIREEVMDYIEGEVVPPSPKLVAFAHLDAGTKREIADTKPADPETTSPEAETKPSDSDAKITEEQSKEFRAAYKAAGWPAAAVAAYLKDSLKVGKLGDITVAMFGEAMAWAKKGPEKPAAPQPETATQSNEQKFCLKQWDAMGTHQDERLVDVEKFTKDGVTDWETLSMELHSRREAAGV